MSGRNRSPNVQGSDDAEPRARDHRHVVMSEYSGWTIRIRPVLVESGAHWGALVDVWPPEERKSIGQGTVVEFPDRRLQQSAILGAAIETARRYIEKSCQHRLPGDSRRLKRRPGARMR
jgi:hypothetical protein